MIWHVPSDMALQAKAWPKLYANVSLMQVLGACTQRAMSILYAVVSCYSLPTKCSWDPSCRSFALGTTKQGVAGGSRGRNQYRAHG